MGETNKTSSVTESHGIYTVLKSDRVTKEAEKRAGGLGPTGQRVVREGLSEEADKGGREAVVRVSAKDRGLTVPGTV